MTNIQPTPGKVAHPRLLPQILMRHDPGIEVSDLKVGQDRPEIRVRLLNGCCTTVMPTS